MLYALQSMVHSPRSDQLWTVDRGPLPVDNYGNSLSGTILTGPNRPAGKSGFPDSRNGAVVLVIRCSSGSSRSPINRLAHVLVTSMRSAFTPSRKAAVISTRYGAVQATPQNIPFTKTSAIFSTRPTSSHVREDCLPF